MRIRLRRARWLLLTIMLAVGLMAVQMTALAQDNGPFDLTWNTVDSSGATSSHGGDFELIGTTGQFDAAGAPYPEMTTPPGGLGGGVFRILFGGFWQPLQNGTLAVRMRTLPVDDSSTWLIDVDGLTPFTTTLPSGAGSEPRVVATGPYTITETAGEGVAALAYTPGYSCTVNGLPGPAGAGSTLNVDVAANRDVVCTFTNVRRTRMLTVTKALTPTVDDGLFVMHVGDRAGLEAGHGALVTATAYVSATTFFSETAGAGSDLLSYATDYACDDPAHSRGAGARASLVMPDADVTCVFTNTRKTRTMTVTKALSPTADAGLFIMHVGNKSGVRAGHGALITATVDVSATVHFSETAGANTDLGSYATRFACDHGGPSGVETYGSLTVPDADVTCVFTNTRKTRTLTVTKALSPTADAGLFIMHADGNASAAAGNGATVTATVDVGVRAFFSETASAGADLGRYATAYACDQGGPVGVGTYGNLAMPDADVTCVFTNTRKTRKLTVVKLLLPINDPGLFVVHAGGNASAEAGHGATAATAVEVGATVAFSETAGAATDLANYMTVLGCNDPDATQGETTRGALIMPDANVVCTFTNTRRNAFDHWTFLPLVKR